MRRCSSRAAGYRCPWAARRASAARGITFLRPHNTSGGPSRAPGAAARVARYEKRVASGHGGPSGGGSQRRRQQAAPRPPLPSQRGPVAGEGAGGGAGGGLSLSPGAPRPLTSATLRARPSLVLALEKHTHAHTYSHPHTHTHTHRTAQPALGDGPPNAASAASGSGGAAPRGGGVGQHGGAQGWAGRPRLRASPLRLGSRRPRTRPTLAPRPRSARGRSVRAPARVRGRRRGSAARSARPGSRSFAARPPAGAALKPEPWNRRRSST